MENICDQSLTPSNLTSVSLGVPIMFSSKKTMINFVPFSVWQRTRMVRIGFLKRLFKNRFRLLFGIAPTSGVADIKSNFQMPKRLFPPKVQRWMEQCFINRRNNPRPIKRKDIFIPFPARAQ